MPLLRTPAVAWNFTLTKHNITLNKCLIHRVNIHAIPGCQLDEPQSFCGNRQRHTFVKLLKCCVYRMYHIVLFWKKLLLLYPEMHILEDGTSQIIWPLVTEIQRAKSILNYFVDWNSRCTSSEMHVHWYVWNTVCKMQINPFTLIPGTTFLPHSLVVVSIHLIWWPWYLEKDSTWLFKIDGVVRNETLLASSLQVLFDSVPL